MKGWIILASYRKLITKDGRVFYEISVSRGRGKSRLTRRWYPPDNWSRKAIERELAAVAAEFERQSDAGEIVSRAEQREKAALEAAIIFHPAPVWRAGLHAIQDGHHEREQPGQLPGILGQEDLSSPG